MIKKTTPALLSRLVALCVWGAGFSAAGAEEPITIESLLIEMLDRDAVASFPRSDFRLKQQSSYDRSSKTPDEPQGWFANKDFNKNFIRIEENNGRQEWVLMEHEGAGAIVRTWMPDDRKMRNQHLDTRICIYLDGATEPAFEGQVYDLLNGTSQIPYPLGHKSLRSAVSFFPIPYAKSCKVTQTEAPFFFVFTYREYPEGTPVRTFNMADFKAAAATTKRTCQTLLDPQNATRGEAVSLKATLDAEQGKTLELRKGTAAVRALSVKLGNYEDPGITRSVVLKMSFDGRETVWCPIGDFFGTGIGLHPFQGWYRTVARDGTLSCRWVMPYRESGEISIVNLGDKPVDFELDAVVGDWAWDQQSMYFNAAWHQQYPVPTMPRSDWNYVTLKGRGVYVGDTLTVTNPIPTWWGEGDEKIFVDGETFPSIFGTGTEDYYGYSWGGVSTDFYEHPFHAQPRCHIYDQLNRKTTNEKDTSGHSTETRTRSLDTMPFGSSLQLDMEVWHWKDCDMSYGVSTYWYGFADTISNRKPDPEGAVVLPPLPEAGATADSTASPFDGAVECESMEVVAKSEGITARPQPLKHLAGNWSAASQLFVRKGTLGDFVEMRFPAKGKTPARLILHATRSYDYGILRFTINGHPVIADIDLYANKPSPSGPIELGVFEPVAGAFTLRAEIIGKNPTSSGTYFGLDCVATDSSDDEESDSKTGILKQDN